MPGETGGIAGTVVTLGVEAKIRSVTTEVLRAPTQTRIACHDRGGGRSRDGDRTDGTRASQYQHQRRYAATAAALRSRAGAASRIRLDAGILELGQARLCLDRGKLARCPARLPVPPPALGAQRQPLGLSTCVLGPRSALEAPRQRQASRPPQAPRRSRSLIVRSGAGPGVQAPGFFMPARES